jgi:hypothetical protein
MTEQQLAKWRAAKLAILAKPLSRECLYCGALPGFPCVTKTGRDVLTVGQMHEARLTTHGMKYRRYR